MESHKCAVHVKVTKIDTTIDLAGSYLPPNEGKIKEKIKKKLNELI